MIFITNAFITLFMTIKTIMIVFKASRHSSHDIWKNYKNIHTSIFGFPLHLHRGDMYNKNKVCASCINIYISRIL